MNREEGGSRKNEKVIFSSVYSGAKTLNTCIFYFFYFFLRIYISLGSSFMYLAGFFVI